MRHSRAATAPLHNLMTWGELYPMSFHAPDCRDVRCPGCTNWAAPVLREVARRFDERMMRDYHGDQRNAAESPLTATEVEAVMAGIQEHNERLLEERRIAYARDRLDQMFPNGEPRTLAEVDPPVRPVPQAVIDEMRASLNAADRAWPTEFIAEQRTATTPEEVVEHLVPVAESPDTCTSAPRSKMTFKQWQAEAATLIASHSRRRR